MRRLVVFCGILGAAAVNSTLTTRQSDNAKQMSEPLGSCFSWDSSCVRPPPQPRPTCYSWDSTCVKPVAADTPVKASPLKRRSRRENNELKSTYDGGDTGSSSGGGGIEVGPCWSTTSGCVPIPQMKVPKTNKRLRRNLRRKIN